VVVVLEDAKDSEASETINGLTSSSTFAFLAVFLLPVIAVLSYTIIVSLMG
jgi:nitrate reductase NapE component